MPKHWSPARCIRAAWASASVLLIAAIPGYSLQVSAQQVQTVLLPLQSTNWSSDATFVKFNPVLGVLTNVQVEFAARVETTFRLENTFVSPQIITFQVGARGTLAVPSLPPGIVVQAQTPSQTVEMYAFDGTIDFGGSSGLTFTQGAEATTTQIMPPPFEALTAFTAAGPAPETVTLGCAFSGQATASGDNGNLANASSTAAGASITLRYTYTVSDCNQNGVPDAIDVSSGASLDCDGNQFPDECEFDFDVDVVPDRCDPDCFTGQGSAQPDSDGDGLVDPCDRFDDCDADGIPDTHQDDANSNGVQDTCEFPDDCNMNGLPDAFDIALGTSPDLDGNQVPDECAGAAQGFFADCACEAHTVCAGSPNSAGPGATLGIRGSCSVWRDDFGVRVRHAPSGKTGCFIMGDVALPAPFGAGVLCIGGNLRRFAPVVTNAAGTADLDLPIAALSSGPHAIHAGDMRSFQFLYRDVFGATLLNASDSIYVVFCP